MTPAQSFSEWHEAQFNMTREELASLRNSAEAFLGNPLVKRLFTQMEANAVKYLLDCDPMNKDELSARLVMVKAAGAMPRVLEALVEDKQLDKALNR